MAAYTGIGSRKDVPPEVIRIMEDAGFRLARMGITLRSGKAEGCDAAFQRGAEKYHRFCKLRQRPSSIAEIYVPWRRFKGGEGLSDIYDIVTEDLDREYPGLDGLREEWVKEVHGGWDKLTDGVKKLHERNVHQLFGPDLGNAYLNQSKFVLYYAPETKSGSPKGGTATGVNLAKKQGIRVLNLLHKENWEILENFLVATERKRGFKN